MKLLDVSDQELEELERTGKPREFMTLRSPVTGTVIEKNVLEHEYITPRRDLYVVADLSTVWVQAKVYEYELPHIELGKPAAVTVAALPGRQFPGKVVFVQPTVEEATRTIQVRVELPNPDGWLKPGMFADIVITHPMGEGLLVPTSAVIRTGERDIAFRVESKNRFVPVEVEIGEVKFGDRFQVLKGLQEGDRVVTSANFLIDSESRLQEGGSGMPGMDMGGMKGKDGQGDMEGMKGMDRSHEALNEPPSQGPRPMIARVIEFSARNPFLIVVLVAAILAGGGWAIVHTPLDAIPDLSDVQVIVYTPWEDRSPDIIEDQVTYPIVTQLLSAPHVKAVRANSFFGFSLIYVIFDDGTDLYWARSRVLEYMSGMAGKLPAGVAPQLGPDATGVGWGLEYVLIDRTGRHTWPSCARSRTGTSSISSGPFPAWPRWPPSAAYVKQYQVTIDPDKLLAYDIPINRVVERDSDEQPGGRRPGLEFTGASTWCADGATSRGSTTSRRSAWGPRRTGRRSESATWATCSLAPTSAAAWWTTTAWGTPPAASLSFASARASTTCSRGSSRRSARRSGRRSPREWSWSSPTTAPP